MRNNINIQLQYARPKEVIYSHDRYIDCPLCDKSIDLERENTWLIDENEEPVHAECDQQQRNEDNLTMLIDGLVETPNSQTVSTNKTQPKAV